MSQPVATGLPLPLAVLLLLFASLLSHHHASATSEGRQPLRLPLLTVRRAAAVPEATAANLAQHPKALVGAPPAPVNVGWLVAGADRLAEEQLAPADGGKPSSASGSSSPVTTLPSSVNRATTIAIGTPPQKMQVHITTRSHHFWVLDTAAPELEEKGGRKKQRYDAAASSTARRATADDPIVFQTGCSCGCGNRLQGQVVNDSIQIGGQTIAGVEFGSITNFDENFKHGDGQEPFEGRIGFAFANETGTGPRKIASPMRSLVEGQAQPLVTFYQKGATFAAGEPFLDGSLTIGGENPEECGPFQWLPAGNSSSVELQVTALRLGSDFDVQIKPRTLIMDEEPALYTTKAEADRIAKQLGATSSTRYGYPIDCAKRGKLPPLRLTLGPAVPTASDGKAEGKATAGTVELELDQYIANMDAKNCLLLIYGYTDVPSKPMYMGNQLLQGRCFALNPRQRLVGFASAKKQ